MYNRMNSYWLEMGKKLFVWTEREGLFSLIPKKLKCRTYKVNSVIKLIGSFDYNILKKRYLGQLLVQFGVGCTLACVVLFIKERETLFLFYF